MATVQVILQTFSVGTVYKGGFVVGLILTLLFTVICLGIERFFAIKTAAGKINLAKFTADVKALIKAQKFDEADKLCDKMQGSVANVVKASIKMYQTVEGGTCQWLLPSYLWVP